ncbi:LPXTG cell wall anchor domain-containing protein [Arthrobacter sp. 4R501]|uniref:LPXTG cell wall anchor domain-containing protein n=1 Tax=Arthrobacter sp. 4R501 TaxID=2058886 RepID=UPI000CE2FF96|nr:LPXTG cell wall anchor domain-containing protein [Arthrobacter sp. 4R501]
MKRTFATLGVLGLAMLSVTAPAYAASDFTLCHNGSELTIDISGSGALAGHTRHRDDIIPPNAVLPDGFNWPAGGDPEQPCLAVVVVPPVVVPPVVVPPVVVPPVVVPPVVVPPVVPPVVDPPAVVPQTQVAGAAVTPAAQTPAPKAAAAKAPAAAAAAVSQGTNEGFNAQTAIGGSEESTTWLAGLGVLLGAGAVVAVRRKSRTESPTAG